MESKSRKSSCGVKTRRSMNEHSAFDGARIMYGVYKDVPPSVIAKIDVQEAIQNLGFFELVVLMKELEGYRGNEIANYLESQGAGNTCSKQRVTAIKRKIRKKFLDTVK